MAKTPEAKITAIFKAMLTREPTSDEMAMILEDVKKSLNYRISTGQKKGKTEITFPFCLFFNT